MTTADAGHQAAWIPDVAGSFGARLALVRQRQGWGNVKEAALACGLPVQSWRNWERDNREPQRYVEVCRTIAERTGVDLVWLMTGQAAANGGAVVNAPERRRTPRVSESFSCRTRGIRTRLHAPARSSFTLS